MIVALKNKRNQRERKIKLRKKCFGEINSRKIEIMNDITDIVMSSCHDDHLTTPQSYLNINIFVLIEKVCLFKYFCNFI